MCVWVMYACGGQCPCIVGCPAARCFVCLGSRCHLHGQWGMRDCEVLPASPCARSSPGRTCLGRWAGILAHIVPQGHRVLVFPAPRTSVAAQLRLACLLWRAKGLRMASLAHWAPTRWQRVRPVRVAVVALACALWSPPGSPPTRRVCASFVVDVWLHIERGRGVCLVGRSPFEDIAAPLMRRMGRLFVGFVGGVVRIACLLA